ncbi:PTS sugar transporter subunit IIA [Candidatus Enterococcus ferrettii]|uniref:PTS EIIA type-2 domain-containing protein n=1 Tax=Candidatus Enterococcus ferrettii TaxID=2815324 RepID=A0ABV0EM09_9ENTE|nr:PTS sugar transporter subunit IIA [Enterococcus sp. 665A]MBO1338346.1 PTS sugar transporter subunit IIA [Enterococcus sp. 665A]
MKKILCDEKQKYLYCTFDETDKEMLLKKMSDVLYDHGFVKASYQEAVIEREKNFPTGLPTAGICVAIPHTDSDHVEKEGFLVGVLKQPVTFEIMASNHEYVDVELVFMLAIKEPEQQLVMLQRLIALCQDEKNLHLLKQGKQVDEVEQLLETIN